MAENVYAVRPPSTRHSLSWEDTPCSDLASRRDASGKTEQPQTCWHLRHQDMGIGTADEAREPGQTVDNVIAVRRRSGSLSWLGSRRRQRCDNDSHSRERNDFRPWSHHGKDDHTYNTMPVGDQILRPRVGGHPIMRSLERGNTLELGIWSSNRKRVTTMARMLAAGNSVTPTISKCYSFPDLVRKSDRGMRSKNSERGGMGRESPFSPERLAMKALTTFRR